MVASALFLLTALSSSFFTLVRAVAPFPLVPSNLTAGTTVQIGWDAATDQGWDSMKVELMGGSNYVMNPLMTLGTNQNGMASGSVQLNVPCVSPYGQFYFIRFTSSDSNVPPNYSTRSTIVSPDGKTDPAPNMFQPDGQPIPWANGTIIPCSGSSKTSTSTTSTSTSTTTSTTTSSSTTTSATTSSTTTSTTTSSTTTSSTTTSSPQPSNTDPGTEPASSSTGSSGGRPSSIVLTPTTTPTPTGDSPTVTVTTTVTVTKWGRHPPDSATRMTTKYSTSTWSQSTSTSTSTSSQSTSTSTSTSSQSPTPTLNDVDVGPLFTVAPQVKTKAQSGAASMKRNLGAGSILAVLIAAGALVY